MTTTILLPILVMGTETAGCVHSDFLKTTGTVVPVRSSDCYLDMVFQGSPPYPYIVLGEVTTNSTAPGPFAIGENNVVAMRRMIERACAGGAHGLMNVDVNSQRVRVGKGYWKSTTASAIAFIYVDASGRPLPAPSGPGAAIQPGS